MESEKSILVVDDNAINREVLREILKTEYSVREAENGEEALRIMREMPDRILAVLSDIVMPLIDGFQLLEEISNDSKLGNIPIIVMTASSENQEKIKALRMGAWDFITKPYNPEVILCRLRNAIGRSEVAAAEQMRHMACHDQLTGIYNRVHFMKKTESMIKRNADKQFVFVYFEVDRFQLINTFYGAKEADSLIQYLAKILKLFAETYDLFTYGRMESDVFCFCMEYDADELEQMIDRAKSLLEQYGSDYDIEPNFGLYVVKDNRMPAEVMYSNASVAAKEGAGNYLKYFTYYTDEMDAKLKKEQEILNDMHRALENEEFCIYLQPKYNIHTNAIAGAEALVRWMHPEKGMISPGDFIPVFENNGFITNLDYYMWEETCKLLRSWIDEGLNPLPISVNVSRVDIYNSRLAESIVQLVDKYQLPHDLLEFEITESAYAFNPMILIKLVSDLHENGFTILMDDFGNGYSSLSILKDIEVDILKLDMLFLSNSKDTGRGENILASVIRMAKWLKIPVIVEGVETASQVNFLKSVGCDYVQGYYYAKPMSVGEYKKLRMKAEGFDGNLRNSDNDDFDVDSLFQSNPQMKVLFGDLLQALAIFEFDGQNMEFVRINEGYYDLFGSDDPAIRMGNPIEIVDSQYRDIVMNSFRTAVKTHGTAECDFIRYTATGASIWVNLKLRYLKEIGNKHLVLGLLDDVTAQKRIDFELTKYRQALIGEGRDGNIMMVVDDMPANRAILKKIFSDQYTIIEASDGMDALEKLNEAPNVSVILLDIVMPRMNGWDFLQHKRNLPAIANIPVIIISAEDKLNEQEIALDMGINDYIVKPFVPEIVKKRVSNAMDSIKFMQEAVRKYDSAAQMARIDRTTGLYHLDAATKIVDEYLEDFADDLNVMVTFAVDNFAETSRQYLEHYDESLVKKIGRIIKELFRRDDVGFRTDDDIFGVFAKNYKDLEKLKERLDEFIELVTADNSEDHVVIVCSIGAAFSPGAGKTFDELYENAEIARLNAKNTGENISSIYNERN